LSSSTKLNHALVLSSDMTSAAEARLAEEEAVEKAKLTTQVLELQNTLEQLSNRVDGVKEDNLKLKSENQVLGQYIENLMNASNVFQSTNTPRPTQNNAASSKSASRRSHAGKKAEK